MYHNVSAVCGICGVEFIGMKTVPPGHLRVLHGIDPEPPPEQKQRKDEAEEAVRQARIVNAQRQAKWRNQ